MRFWIDVESGAGVKLGDGPIISATSWRNVARLDRAGEFSFEMPANDPRSGLVYAKRIARCYGQLEPGGAITEFGAGVIDSIEVVPGRDGATLRVSGGDLLRELTYRSVGFMSLTDGAGGPTATALAQIIAPATGWTFDPAGFGTTGVLDYANLAGESILSVLVRIAEHNGQHFRLGTGRSVRWLRSGLLTSDVTLVGGGDPVALAANPDACLIQSLQETQETYDLITRIYGYGSGNANARLTLAATNKSAPAGYTLDKPNSCLIANGPEASYGRIERYLAWKEVAPISNSATDMRSAANVLFDAMYAQLSRQSLPANSYRLALAGGRIIRPGEQVRVDYDRWVDGYHAVSIHGWLAVLESTTQLDASGLRTVGLQVSTVDQWPVTASEMQASELERGRFMEAHPQLTIAYSPVGPYTRRMDDTHNADFTVRIGKEVTNLNYAILRFKTGPLVSSVKSVGSTVSGSIDLDPHSHTVPNHMHAMLVKAEDPFSTVVPVTIDIYGNGLYSGHSGDLTIHTTNSSGATTSDGGGGGTFAVDLSGAITADYGLYEDNSEHNYPEVISIEIDGTDRTAALGGPWAAGGGSASDELEITSYLLSNLQSNHTIAFSCASGQGEIEVECDMLCSVQAIAMV